MPKGLFTRYLIPLFGAGMFIFALHSVLSQDTRADLKPPLKPTSRQWQNQIAGIGILEPRSETITIGSPLPAIVESINVKAGTTVKKGDVLFVLDKRQAEATRNIRQAEYDMAVVQLADARDQLQRFESVKKGIAIGESRLARQRFATDLAAATVATRKAALRDSEILLERHTVTAPVDGTILKVNLRPGEFAASGALPSPLITMGNITPWHLRVEIDATQAHRLKSSASAVASPRGNPDKQYSLTWVRTEPAAVPKLSLTGDKTERVDTRVVQVIYAVDNTADTTPGLFNGMEMDVAIETDKLSLTGR